MARVGVGLNLRHPASELVDVATASERLGYDSFWLHENPLIGDSMAALLMIARETEKIRLGVACISAITRHPVLSASSAITIQNESGGRFILGIGLGGFPWLPLIGYPVHPVSETRPMRRLVEAVRVLRMVLDGGVAELDGEFYKVRNLRLLARPVKRIPIYLASLSRLTLTKAPSLVDGVITSPGVLTPRDVGRMVEWVRRGEEKAGRSVEKGAYVMVSVSSDVEEAFKAVKRDPFFLYMLAEVVSEESLREYGASTSNLEEIRRAWRGRDLARASQLVENSMVEALTASGRPEDVRERMEEYLSTGLDLAIITPVGDVARGLETLSPG